jgi:folylpolyglutamate synthase
MFVASILDQFRKSGKLFTKIGLFTSPHLIHVRERIMINGEPLSEEAFASYFFRLWAMLSNHPLSGECGKPPLGYFPFLTLLSFFVFQHEDIDFAVIETGVGGEYDVTNIVPKPLVCGITSLEIDHMTKLGKTLEEISWHKAGIFKTNCPALSVQQLPECFGVLERRAKEKQTQVRCVPLNTELTRVKIQPAEQYQYQNASLAVAVCEEILKHYPADISKSEVWANCVAGLEEATLPGRAQTLYKYGITWKLDVAHTPASLRKASSWFMRSAAEE